MRAMHQGMRADVFHNRAATCVLGTFYVEIRTQASDRLQVGAAIGMLKGNGFRSRLSFECICFRTVAGHWAAGMRGRATCVSVAQTRVRGVQWRQVAWDGMPAHGASWDGGMGLPYLSRRSKR